MSGLSALPDNLDALEERLRQDLSWLELPAKSWVPPRAVDGKPVNIPTAKLPANSAVQRSEPPLESLRMASALSGSATPPVIAPWC